MPTKKELLRVLEEYDDDTQITLWQWSDLHGSSLELLNLTCTSYMDSVEPHHKHPAYIAFSRSGVYINQDKKDVIEVIDHYSPRKKGG